MIAIKQILICYTVVQHIMLYLYLPFEIFSMVIDTIKIAIMMVQCVCVYIYIQFCLKLKCINNFSKASLINLQEFNLTLNSSYTCFIYRTVCSSDQPFRALQLRSRNPISVIDMCFAQVLRFLLMRGNGNPVSVTDTLCPISRIPVHQLWPRQHSRRLINLD